MTLNGDLRSEDFLLKGLLTKILGHHSNALFGDYKTTIENRAWDTYATDTAFANAMGDPTGSISTYRTISWVDYLGPTMVNLKSPSGLNLSNMANTISPTSTTILNFNNTWTATGVNPGAAWTDPSPYATNPSTQAENPAELCRLDVYAGQHPQLAGRINDLYTLGTKTQQILKSVAFMYQGHMLDDTIVPEFGWRRDEISVASNAPLDPNTHVASMNYGITGSAVGFTTNSTS